MNDALAGVADASGDRLLGLAHAPPLGGAEALAEVERACTELGFRGVATVTINGGAALDDPRLEPFLATAVGREFELQLAALDEGELVLRENGSRLLGTLARR